MRKVVLDQIEILSTGEVRVRLHKQVWDGGDLLSTEFHRLSIGEGMSIEDEVAAVNLHLVAGVENKTGTVIKWPEIENTADLIDQIRRHREVMPVRLKPEE